MTREQLNHAIAAVLTTLAEVDGGAPSGHLYMALQSYDAELYTHSAYMMTLGALIRAEIVTEERDYIELTSKGRNLAAELEAAIAAHRAAHAGQVA